MSLYLAPVNLDRWNMFENACAGHVEDFKAPSSACVGDMVAMYVTKSGCGRRRPGIYAYGKIVKAPYESKGETRVDVEFERIEDYPLVTNDEVQKYVKCFMRFQRVNEMHEGILRELMVGK